LAATPAPDDHLALIAANINLDFYRNQIGKVEITTHDAARHYLELGSRMGLDPAPDFSSSGYLKLHPDVAAAGLNPYVHYLATGRTEQRKTLASHIITTNQRPDGKSEWSHYERMRHLAEKVGGAQPPNLSALNFAVTLTGGDLVKAVMGARLRNPAEAEDAPPEISVLIPCLNEAAVTAECLISVFRASIEARLEIILIDNGSTDAFFKGISGHSDIITLSPGMNIGFGPAMNLAAQRASAPYLLLLNNDTQIAPGCVTALRAALIADATRAVVGPKIISFDGRLQEAGVLLEADGTGDLIGFARHPDEPRFNYPRDVEHLSAACTMMPRKLFIDCGGFDPVYAPAYCEDADLSLRLRAMGYRLHYVPDALVAHHLSKTSSETGSSSGGARSAAKAKLLSRNRATLISRWVNELGRFDIRTIAFYLPQYHPIPENDLWWGKGFTEWRNLAKARPNFIGHRQPRYPADLGYYDLRVPEIMDQQAQMARRYGISGFCYYYYRFGDRRLLEMPIETMLASRKPDFPFCLCWANENWSRRWDGMDHDLLVKQKYGEIDAIGFADDVVRYFRDDRYIRVNGSPLILFYRLQEIPNPKRYLGVCRNVWHQAGFSEVMVAMVESFELSPQPRNPGDFGADITVEFPAHGMVHDTPLPVTRSNPHWTGNAHDYRELVHAFMRREEAGFKRIRSVLVGWDTSPRHQDRSFVLQHNTPGAFQAWLEWTYQRTREQNFGEERLVFINAWNEWCEGSYLEPDLDYGHAYLQAVRNAQEAVTGKGQCFVEVR
jgi:GT2 family glycosyltransferase